MIAKSRKTGNRWLLIKAGGKSGLHQSAVLANGQGSLYNEVVTESATENIPLIFSALREKVSKGEKAR